MLKSEQINHQQIPAILCFIFQKPVRTGLNYKIPTDDNIFSWQKYCIVLDYRQHSCSAF
jgi:hypothetical protein